MLWQYNTMTCQGKNMLGNSEPTQRHDKFQLTYGLKA